MKKAGKPLPPVTLRTKGNTGGRRNAGDLAGEPEMKELSRMVEAGELDADRAARHARSEADRQRAKP